MNREQAMMVVGTLAAAHPAWKATRETVALWVEMLDDLDYEAARAAARRLIATSTAWPSVALLRHAVAREGGLLPPSADEACQEVLLAARRCGRHGWPEWTHPLVGEVAQSIGWTNICTTSLPGSVAVQYRKAYEVAAHEHVEQVTDIGGAVGNVKVRAVLASVEVMRLGGAS
jgi:hypothetical protein